MPLDLTQDHAEVAWGHWLAQFVDGSNLEAIVKSLYKPLNDVQGALLQLLNDRWLDTAEGAQLDGIGDIVGMPRTIDETVYVEFFGFSGQPSIKGFSKGRFRRDGESITGGSTTLLDPEYRKVLYWKIAVNNGHGTTPEIIAAAKVIFDVTQVIVQDMGDAKIAVWLNGLNVENSPLFANGKRWIPKAAGVGVELNAGTNRPFGFQSQGFYGFDDGIMSRGI